MTSFPTPPSGLSSPFWSRYQFQAVFLCFSIVYSFSLSHLLNCLHLCFLFHLCILSMSLLLNWFVVLSHYCPASSLPQSSLSSLSLSLSLTLTLRMEFVSPSAPVPPSTVELATENSSLTVRPNAATHAVGTLSAVGRLSAV